MSAVAVIPVFRADDGRWEASVPVVHGSGDIETRDSVDDLPHERARVVVQGVERELTLYRDPDDDDTAFVIWDEALPG